MNLVTYFSSIVEIIIYCVSSFWHDKQILLKDTTTGWEGHVRIQYKLLQQIHNLACHFRTQEETFDSACIILFPFLECCLWRTEHLNRVFKHQFYVISKFISFIMEFSITTKFVCVCVCMYIIVLSHFYFTTDDVLTMKHHMPVFCVNLHDNKVM